MSGKEYVMSEKKKLIISVCKCEGEYLMSETEKMKYLVFSNEAVESESEYVMSENEYVMYKNKGVVIENEHLEFGNEICSV